jgi:hypothetical protein
MSYISYSWDKIELIIFSKILTSSRVWPKTLSSIDRHIQPPSATCVPCSVGLDCIQQTGTTMLGDTVAWEVQCILRCKCGQDRGPLVQEGRWIRPLTESNCAGNEFLDRGKQRDLCVC